MSDFLKKFSVQPFSLPNLSLPYGKLGILFGSLAVGQWVINDLVHVPGGGIGFLVAGAGAWWFTKPLKGSFNVPSTVNGWTRLCYEVLGQFESLEKEDQYVTRSTERSKAFRAVLDRSEPQKIAFVCSDGAEMPEKKDVESAIAGSKSINMSWLSSLPSHDKNWSWPKALHEQDFLVYCLPLPLKAVDLLWLENVPEDQPSWVMVHWEDKNTWSDQIKALQAQLPHRWTGRILRSNGDNEQLNSSLKQVRRLLEQPRKNIDNTKQRLLCDLHASWQTDLELLRRDKFKAIQNRTQWLVAGAVFASPVASADLLAVAVVNGLMIKEMAQVWSCKWKPETLKIVAKQLSCAAVAQGVVEWSGQTLLGVAKLHGGSWLAAGTLQALSAAYLTRVVGRSMSDWMAINNGVTEPDLELLKQQASTLIAKAANEERLDWKGFLKQATTWMDSQSPEVNIQQKLIESN